MCLRWGARLVYTRLTPGRALNARHLWARQSLGCSGPKLLGCSPGRWGMVTPGGGRNTARGVGPRSTQNWACDGMFNFVGRANAFPSRCVHLLSCPKCTGLPAPACSLARGGGRTSQISPVGQVTGGVTSWSASHILTSLTSLSTFPHRPRRHVSSALHLPVSLLGFCDVVTHNLRTYLYTFGFHPGLLAHSSQNSWSFLREESWEHLVLQHLVSGPRFLNHLQPPG